MQRLQTVFILGLVLVSVWTQPEAGSYLYSYLDYYSYQCEPSLKLVYTCVHTWTSTCISVNAAWSWFIPVLILGLVLVSVWTQPEAGSYLYSAASLSAIRVSVCSVMLCRSCSSRAVDVGDLGDNGGSSPALPALLVGCKCDINCSFSFSKLCTFHKSPSNTPSFFISA